MSNYCFRGVQIVDNGICVRRVAGCKYNNFEFLAHPLQELYGVWSDIYGNIGLFAVGEYTCNYGFTFNGTYPTMNEGLIQVNYQRLLAFVLGLPGYQHFEVLQLLLAWYDCITVQVHSLKVLFKVYPCWGIPTIAHSSENITHVVPFRLRYCLLLNPTGTKRLPRLQINGLQ